MSSSSSIPVLGQKYTTSSLASVMPTSGHLGSDVSSTSATTSFSLFQTSLFSSRSSLLGQGCNSTTSDGLSSSTSIFQTPLFSSVGNGSWLGQGFSVANSTASMPSFICWLMVTVLVWQPATLVYSRHLTALVARCWGKDLIWPLLRHPHYPLTYSTTWTLLHQLPAPVYSKHHHLAWVISQLYSPA